MREGHISLNRAEEYGVGAEGLSCGGQVVEGMGFHIVELEGLPDGVGSHYFPDAEEAAFTQFVGEGLGEGFGQFLTGGKIVEFEQRDAADRCQDRKSVV